MERYKEEQRKRVKNSIIFGVVMAIVAHGIITVLLISYGLTYFDPPPKEKMHPEIILNEIEIEKEEPEQKWGPQPRTPDPEKTKEVNLIQESQSQVTADSPNVAEESTLGDQGDVEQYEAPRDEPINIQSLYTNAKNKQKKDTLDMQKSREPSEELKAGHPQGNTDVGETEGDPKANVKGRQVNGVLAKPAHIVKQEGTIVVDVIVDCYGNVTQVGIDITKSDITDSKLVNSTLEAAKKAKFMKRDDDITTVDKGTITYIFKL